MSFADKVNALRHFFSIPDAQDLMSAVAAMNAAMGIIANGVLPVQVDMLIAATGVHATAAPTGRFCGPLRRCTHCFYPKI